MTVRKGLFFIFTAACLCLLPAGAKAQKMAVKTNIAYWATATINLGGEVRLAPRSTLDLTVGYNPWTWDNNKKWKHWLVMPEYRYYFCESFNGHFLGVHAGFAQYNICGTPLLLYKDADLYRYQGWATGAGISYGYQWILGRRWNLEATIGVGVVYTDYEKYYNGYCGAKLGRFDNLFFSPTKFGINLVYLIK